VRLGDCASLYGLEHGQELRVLKEGGARVPLQERFVQSRLCLCAACVELLDESAELLHHVLLLLRHSRGCRLLAAAALTRCCWRDGVVCCSLGESEDGEWERAREADGRAMPACFLATQGEGGREGGREGEGGALGLG
jgi:hypothetical protein